MVSIARLSVVKQSSFGLPGQYGRRVTRVNGITVIHIIVTFIRFTAVNACPVVIFPLLFWDGHPSKAIFFCIPPPIPTNPPDLIKNEQSLKNSSL